MERRVKGSGRYRRPVTECVSHRDEMYSIRNLVNGTVIGFRVKDCGSTCEHSITANRVAE